MPTDLSLQLRSLRIVDERGLKQASDRAATTGEDLVSACWSLKLAPERDLVRVLCDAYGYPGIDLSQSVVRVANMDLVPEDIMLRQLVLPVMDSGFDIVIAMAEPDDHEVYDQLRFLTDRKVMRHVAIPSALRAAIEGVFKAHGANEPYWRGREAWKLDPPEEGKAAVVQPSRSQPPQRFGAGAPAEKAPVSVPVPAAGPAAGPMDDKSWLDGFLAGAALPAPRLPTPATVPPVEQKQAVAGVPPGKTVLLVDDDEAIRVMEAKILAPFNCTILQAGDGKEGLRLARERKPDLVLLDGMLPGMHGFEVCRAIKGDARLRSVAIIMVSGIYTGWRIAADLKSAYGADAFFEKPFAISELTKAIREVLAKQPKPPEPVQSQRSQTLNACRAGLARAQAGAHQEAIAMLVAASKQDPFAAEPYYFLGQVLHEAGHPYHAVASLERAAELRPDLEPPLTLLGELYWALGFRKDAQVALRRARDACTDLARAAQLDARLAAMSRA
ncbi:MAG: response regulator [Myxococcales bacterium]